MLRPGLALYGYLDRLTLDGLSWDGEDPGFAPVLTWKTQVTSLRTLHPGETAGYGNTFTADGRRASPCCRSAMPTGSIACFPTGGMFLSEARRRPSPAVSRWIRPW